jgi:hypothetical protein
VRNEEVAVIVEVIGGADEHPQARVVDIDDLGRLHLALGEVTDVAALRAAAEPRATAPDWSTRWDAMIAGARSQGWLSDDGATLQVRVESAAGG